MMFQLPEDLQARINESGVFRPARQAGSRLDVDCGLLDDFS